MLKRTRIPLAVLLCGAYFTVHASAQQAGTAPRIGAAPRQNPVIRGRNAPMALSALDLHEIEQLSAKYTHAIDSCADTGYQYADLYTPDGVFIDMWSDAGVKAGGEKWQGREKLREIASGANVTGAPCTSPRFNGSITHMILSLVITPTADGATGNSYMLELGGRDPNRITRMGNYEDVYVKTPNGWRFKTRTHSRAPNGQLPAPAK